ncbi:MAG: hypothetical protein IT172_10065 [Acidobacteria bacterium]|nr:hypothetical protein [Acidobacteriota bacterium]
MQTRSRTEEEEAVSAALASLPRADAPPDFEMRVRAGIARGMPARKGGVLWKPVLAALLPLAVVGIAIGLFVFKQDQTAVAVRPVDTVVEIPATNSVADEPQSIDAPSAETAEARETPISEPLTQFTVPVRRRSSTPIRHTERTPASNETIDSSLKPGVQLFPKGLDPNAAPPPQPSDLGKAQAISMKEVIEQFGIEGGFGHGGWHITGVKPASAAERLGIKAGDVIEMIDQKPVEEKATFDGTFNGGSMQIRRDGAKVVVSLDRPQ